MQFAIRPYGSRQKVSTVLFAIALLLGFSLQITAGPADDENTAPPLTQLPGQPALLVGRREGYPGTLTVHVTYELTDDNALKISYHVSTDKPTVVNLTNHSYFNLSGAGSGDILKQVLQLDADHYTPVDDTLIPTGELKSVEGTPFDFRKPTPIGTRNSQIPGIAGYDHNFVLNGTAGKLRKIGEVSDPASGRAMETWTTEPGVQLYVSLGLNGSVKGIGGAYPQFGALCLETQHFPDSPNHPKFPSTVVRPGKDYHSETIYKFPAK